ncbi:MAG: NAD-dependent epimerase/dehydratase family protein [Chitinophagaceae bacterium]|nr:NAD-dependent epimerase/dehydratase family protein [Chitinophagaceae bacterium]
MASILVTGATGFIGNYVVDELLSRGHEVTASSANADRAAVMPWFSKVNYKELNFENLHENVNYFEYFDNPGKIIHLAWEGLPNYKSLFHFEVNLNRHYHFLKNLVENGCRDVTVTGTCFEYGMVSGCLDETMPSQPANPYSLAKDTLHKFLTEFSKSETFSLKWVRLFYMYGKGQNPASLLSQLQKAIDNKDEVFNMSGGEQVRDYLPVEKVAEYIVTIALQNKITGTINCCSGKPVKIKDFVYGYLRKTNKKIKLNLGHYPYPDYEPMEFWGDNKKLQTILNEK